jgi:hypothetical protein
MVIVAQSANRHRQRHFGERPPSWMRQRTGASRFLEGWRQLMHRLERRFREGPIDWKAEAMMYQRGD